MATPKETLIKFMMLSDILKAASLLHELKLIEEEPAAIVKKYVLANPDINRDLNNEKSAKPTREYAAGVKSFYARTDFTEQSIFRL